MILLAAVALIWLICLVLGAALHIIGKIIWVAVLCTIIAAIWGYIKRRS